METKCTPQRRGKEAYSSTQYRVMTVSTVITLNLIMFEHRFQTCQSEIPSRHRVLYGILRRSIQKLRQHVLTCASRFAWTWGHGEGSPFPFAVRGGSGTYHFRLCRSFTGSVSQDASGASSEASVAGKTGTPGV